MFKMNHSKVILQLASLFFVTCDFSLGAQKKCAEYNEYCQVHWDCCSNTCLTYSYRCIGKKHHTPTFDRPALTLEELLEGIAEVNTIASTTHSQAHSVTSEINKNALNPLFDVRIETRVVKTVPVLQKLFKAVQRNSHLTANSKEPALRFFLLQSTPLIPQSKQQIQQKIEHEQNATNEASIAKTTDKPVMTAERATVQTPTTQCKEIGEKCYRREDCCTQRCHGFLHQCVT